MLAAFTDHGFQIVEVAAASELPALLPEKTPAAILVYNPSRTSEARHVLRIVGDTGWRTPVIVVVDQGEFEQYYELMCEGAYDYFELADGPEVIERAVRGASHSRAA
jgi:DNA-binding NtrC family response regulator